MSTNNLRRKIYEYAKYDRFSDVRLPYLPNTYNPRFFHAICK